MFSFTLQRYLKNLHVFTRSVTTHTQRSIAVLGRAGMKTISEVSIEGGRKLIGKVEWPLSAKRLLKIVPNVIREDRHAGVIIA